MSFRPDGPITRDLTSGRRGAADGWDNPGRAAQVRPPRGGAVLGCLLFLAAVLFGVVVGVALTWVGVR